VETVTRQIGAVPLNDRPASGRAAGATIYDRRLFWVAAGLLPLIMFSIAMLLTFERQQEHAIEHSLREAAGGAAHLIERAVGEQIGILKGMAASLAFDRWDLETVRREAERLWDLHPEWRTVIVTDEHRPLFNLYFPPGEPITPLRDPESLAQVWATGRASAGNLAHGYVGIRVPVVRSGRLVYTIVVPTSSQYFSDQLQAHVQGQPWTAAVVGSDGIVIAATPVSPVPVGQPLPWDIPTSAEGYRADGSDYKAWASVAESGWQVVIVAPATAVEQSYARTRMVVYIGGAFAAILTSVLTLLLSSAWASRREAVRLRSEVEDRKRAEAALRESEEKYRRIVETAHEGIWAMDGRHVTTFVNRHLSGMLGYGIEEMIGRPVNAFMFSEDLQDHAAEMAVRQGGGNGAYERRFRRKDGGEVWTIVSATALKDAEGNFAGSFAMFTDITDRRKAEAQLRESRERYRLVADFTYDWEYWVDPSGKFLYVSPSCERVSGYPPAFFLEDPGALLRIVHPEDRRSLDSHLSENCSNAFQDAAPCEMKFRIIRADGEIRWILHRCWCVFTEDRVCAGRRGSQRDITETNLAEQSLRESEDRNRRLIEASPDAVLIRSGGMITYANPSAVRLLRATSEQDLVGKPYLDLVHPDDRAASAERVRKSLEEGLVTAAREHRLLALDGRVVDVESIGVPAKFQGEIQTFGIFRDITERKKSYQEKAQLEVQLQQAQKMESLGTLAGGIAHDFNNILGVIIGSSELLAMTNAVEESSRGTLDNILAASQRAKDLVRQILAFSRHAKQEKLLLNLKAIVKETIEFLRASLPATIELRQKLDPKAGTIMADPTQMQQVLMNLCTNAAHAMEPTGGILEVQLSNVVLNQDGVRIDSDLEPGAYVRLTVSDTGHGIDPQVIRQIFDPYFTTKEKDKGTGLGLAVVHGIVKAHGGTIKVFSEVGQGTTFQVLLPGMEGYGATERAEIQVLRGGSERILLVDDEKGLADIEKQMLALLGYDVQIRTSPVEALEAFQTNPEKFDLVITDLTMPQMTGMKLAKQMARIRPGMPIILSTGFSDQIDETQALAAGIRAFLLKPLVANELAEAVRKALDDPRI
jgi:PAS domain S-box-containing protein